MIQLCEMPNYYMCFLSDDKKIVFEINACGYDIRYNLSGHPYEPVLYAECNMPRYSFSIHGGLWFPYIPDEKDKHSLPSPEEWRKFCETLIFEIVLRVAWLHNLPDRCEVNFELLKCNELLYNGEALYNTCFESVWGPYLEPCLKIEHPDQRGIPKMEFCGGYPDEYYMFISKLTAKEKKMITTLDGEPVVKSDDETEKLLAQVRKNTLTKFIRVKTIPKTYVTDIKDKDKEGRLSLTKSKFGGYPYWPGANYETYPKADGGITPLTLLAQINFAEIPSYKNDIFPRTGLLQFFILNADDMENYKVVYHKTIDEIEPWHCFIPTSLMPEKFNIRDMEDGGTIKTLSNRLFWGDEGFPVKGELPIEFGWDYKYDTINLSENGFAQEVKKAMKQLNIPSIKNCRDFTNEINLNFIPQSIYELSDNIYESLFPNVDGHKLLGHPNFIQDDYRNDNDEILLLQIDPAGSCYGGFMDENNNITFGDNGNAQFLITKEDLKNLDFSKVRYTWSCL